MKTENQQNHFLKKGQIKCPSTFAKQSETNNCKNTAWKIAKTKRKRKK